MAAAEGNIIFVLLIYSFNLAAERALVAVVVGESICAAHVPLDSAVPLAQMQQDRVQSQRTPAVAYSLPNGRCNSLQRHCISIARANFTHGSL